ncbi:succinate dehydrogenase cytochrome b subunit [Flavobacteriales bacterium]|nr:succinate dehydrogenase cytochrome b subunit [Flavobacteriaceae bacterium]MCH1437218.1 succinate dehydrogenase cytochrome b subunit [Flavobacteriales bacterium]MDB2317486.1 succinate dehydrogenase cytochrome b subunit [Flavobacteriales bacterium]MDG1145449.1 succinate dehydrogenase cytochrome b subunit [Flavobacteriales bacterium]
MQNRIDNYFKNQEKGIIMSNNAGLFSSSLGRKYLMAITGLFLCSFLLVHLIGNVALYTDPVKFNEYTRFMSSNPLIRVMEIILVVGFLAHIIDAVLLTKANKAAQPVKYAMDKKNSSWYSRNMGLTGSIILAFLVLHLQSFWYQYKFGEVVYVLDSNGESIKDMYTIVITAFQQSWYAGIYVIAMVLLGSHLNHGFQSAFQSVGLRHKKYTPTIKKLGTAFSVLITLGFISFPIYFYFSQL